jgi:hypothetical protein
MSAMVRPLGRVNPTSSSTKQTAQRKRVFLEFVGLQHYGLGGAAKSAAKPSLHN